MYSMVLFIVDTSLSGFFGSGREPDICSGEDTSHQFVGCPAGEFDMVRKPQLVAELRGALRSSRPLPDQGESDVCATETVDDLVGGPDHDVDSVLGPHDADVGGEERRPSAEGRPPASPARRPLGVGTGPHDGHVLGTLVSTFESLTAVRLVRGDHVARSRKGAAAPAPRSPQYAIRGPSGKRDSKSSGHRS